MSSCFGDRTKIFVDHCIKHFEKDHGKWDIAGRYRFLPAVKELLMRSQEEPVLNEYGNWVLYGKTKNGEHFLVAVGSEGNECHVKTFHPCGAPRKRMSMRF